MYHNSYNDVKIEVAFNQWSDSTYLHLKKKKSENLKNKTNKQKGLQLQNGTTYF